MLPFHQRHFNHFNHFNLTIPSKLQFHVLSRLQPTQNRCIRCQIADRLLSQLNQNVAAVAELSKKLLSQSSGFVRHFPWGICLMLPIWPSVGEIQVGKQAYSFVSCLFSFKQKIMCPFKGNNFNTGLSHKVSLVYTSNFTNETMNPSWKIENTTPRLSQCNCINWWLKASEVF